MKTVVVYRERSEHARAVESFVRDFESQSRVKVSRKDIDTREGAQFAELYDIVEYPSVVVLRDDGEFVRMWSGTHLPPASEVVGAAHG